LAAAGFEVEGGSQGGDAVGRVAGGRGALVPRRDDAQERAVRGAAIQDAGRDGGRRVDGVGGGEEGAVRRAGQVVVYCDTVKKAVRYAQRWGVFVLPRRHRECGAEGDRAAVDGRVAATNALGSGVDAATIGVVIHVGLVRRLRDYGQERGRAGRDGGQSEAIILRAVRVDGRGGRSRRRRRRQKGREWRRRCGSSSRHGDAFERCWSERCTGRWAGSVGWLVEGGTRGKEQERTEETGMGKEVTGIGRQQERGRKGSKKENKGGNKKEVRGDTGKE
jgi:hypothetical protein